MKYGFIYVWRDRKNNRYYVGSHWGTEDDGYICSSRWMRRAYSRRPKDFKRRIICRVYTNRKDLLEQEHFYLSMIKDDQLKIRYFNLTKHLNSHWFTDEDRRRTISQKISDGTKRAMQNETVRQNYLDGLKIRDTRSSDPEVRKKRSDSRKLSIAKYGHNENSLKCLNPSVNKGKIRLLKDGKFKLVIENSDKHIQLKEDGWQTRLEVLLPLVEKFRYENDDHDTPDSVIYRRMVNIGVLTEKERSFLIENQ